MEENSFQYHFSELNCIESCPFISNGLSDTNNNLISLNQCKEYVKLGINKFFIDSSPRNSKNVSQISDNDSILKDLDHFRQIALNDIGNLDNPNIVQQHAKNRTVDLIPKDVIRNYDKLISSGSRK